MNEYGDLVERYGQGKLK